MANQQRHSLASSSLGRMRGSSDGSIVSPRSCLRDIQSSTTDSEYDNRSVLARASENSPHICGRRNSSTETPLPSSGSM